MTARKWLSSRTQIAIDELSDGLLVLGDGQYRLVMETGALNLELMSEAEQDSLLDSYQAFLNSLSLRLQILVRTRELDVDDYLTNLNSNINDQDVDISQQLKAYRKFIYSLVASRKIMSRRFYLILPYQTSVKNRARIREQLELAAEVISRGLTGLGLSTRILPGHEALNLFYEFYQPKQSRQLLLTAKLTQGASRSYL